jgi:hypothetical protein
MITAIQNKARAKAVASLLLARTRPAPKKNPKTKRVVVCRKHRLVPGKSQEQIRQEALRQLREIGILL